MRKSTRYTLLTLSIVAVALAVLFYLRTVAPPESARLLPESDAIVYLSLKPLRAATHFDRNAVTRSASYQSFVDATGIVAERDVDSAAFALHSMKDPTGPNGSVAFSEVLEGHFDSARLTRYFASIALSQEQYAGHTIYNIPSEGRTLRVAILSYDTVAGSNMPTTEQIHSILDRSHAAASPFSGSSLLGTRFRDVPTFSSAWAIGRLALPFNNQGQTQVMGLRLPIPADATFVASVRYEGALHLRIEEITANSAEAEQAADALNQLLALTKTLQQIQQPTARTPEDRATRTLLQSIHIGSKQARTILTADLPAETLKKLATQ